jgi:hypothetical protein
MSPMVNGHWYTSEQAIDAHLDIAITALEGVTDIIKEGDPTFVIDGEEPTFIIDGDEPTFTTDRRLAALQTTAIVYTLSALVEAVRDLTNATRSKE